MAELLRPLRHAARYADLAFFARAAHWSCSAADVHLELDLPSQWIWDIVDEFIYQFQSFCQFASKLRNKGDEDLEKLKANPKVWKATEVLNYLNRLIEKSQILKYLERERTGQEHRYAIDFRLYKPLPKFPRVAHRYSAPMT